MEGQCVGSVLWADSFIAQPKNADFPAAWATSCDVSELLRGACPSENGRLFSSLGGLRVELIESNAGFSAPDDLETAGIASRSRVPRRAGLLQQESR